MCLQINVTYANCLISLIVVALNLGHLLAVAPEFLTFIDVFADIIMKISFIQLRSPICQEIVSISCRPVCLVHCE